MALKLKDDETPSSPDSYETDELVTYDEARKSANQKPYIAAIITSKDENMFILGDGKNTCNPETRRRRTTTDYYNGPLEPDASYRIFQRIVLIENVCYLFIAKRNKELTFSGFFLSSLEVWFIRQSKIERGIKEENRHCFRMKYENQ